MRKSSTAPSQIFLHERRIPMKKYMLALVLFSTLQHASGALFPDPWNGANLFLIQTVTGGGELTEKAAQVTAAIKHGANPNLVLPITGLGPKESSILALTVREHAEYGYHDFIITLARHVTEQAHFSEAITQAREMAENNMKLAQPGSVNAARYAKDQIPKHKELSEACSRLADTLEALRKEKFPK